MKPLLIFALLACAACANFPELEGSEGPELRKAPYPRLVPISDTLAPPANPVSEAEEVEQELTERSEALAEKAKALQEVEID